MKWRTVKQVLIDSLWFWGFWIILAALVFGIIEATLIDTLKVLLALILPPIIPVTITGFLFDFFFIRKKIFLFFIISIPFCYLSGLLINIWFHFLMKGANINANNEVLIFLFATMFIGFRYIRVALSQRILLKEEENKRVIAELQYLRSQLNPHFLFNALNSVYSLILSQSEKAGEAVLALSELMRFHIDLSGKQFIELREEISMIERYIALEKLKLEDRCDIQFELTGNPDTILIAPLLLMPFVENAFKHGISSLPESNFVHVKLTMEKEEVRIEILNSVPLKQTQGKAPEVKLGIENTLKRLELHYKNKYTFSSSKKEKNYLINLTINFR